MSNALLRSTPAVIPNNNLFTMPDNDFASETLDSQNTKEATLPQEGDLATQTSNASSGPPSMDDSWYQAGLEECKEGFRHGNHDAETQFKRDCDMLVGAMRRMDGQAHYLIALYALLLSGDIFYCSRSQSKFDPGEEDCARFADPQYALLTDQPEYSTRLTIAALLCHGSRLLLEAPKDVRDQVLKFLSDAGNTSGTSNAYTWTGNTSDTNNVYPRRAATHGIQNNRNKPIQLGNRVSRFQELKLNPGQAAAEAMWRAGKLSGINLALGVDGKNPISGENSDHNGEHGHAFMLSNLVADGEEWAAILIGLEPSATRCRDQYQGRHGAGSRQEYSVTGGDYFSRPVNKRDFSGSYAGLSNIDLAGYYDNLRVLIDEAHFVRAKALYEYLVNHINTHSDLSILLDRLLMSRGFVPSTGTQHQYPDILNLFALLGKQFRFKSQDGLEFDAWIPDSNQLSVLKSAVNKLDIEQLAAEYSAVLNRLLAVFDKENSWESENGQNIFFSMKLSTQHNDVKHGDISLPKKRESAIFRQCLTFVSKKGFSRSQDESKVQTWVNNNPNHPVAHLWQMGTQITGVINALRNAKLNHDKASDPNSKSNRELYAEAVDSSINNALNAYKTAQDFYYQILSNSIINSALKKVSAQLPEVFYPFTMQELKSLTEDELLVVCLEEIKPTGLNSELFNRILSDSGLLATVKKAVAGNLTHFQGRTNLEENIMFLRSAIGSNRGGPNFSSINDRGLQGGNTLLPATHVPGGVMNAVLQRKLEAKERELEQARARVQELIQAQKEATEAHQAELKRQLEATSHISRQSSIDSGFSSPELKNFSDDEPTETPLTSEGGGHGDRVSDFEKEEISKGRIITTLLAIRDWIDCQNSNTSCAQESDNDPIDIPPEIMEFLKGENTKLAPLRDICDHLIAHYTTSPLQIKNTTFAMVFFGVAAVQIIIAIGGYMSLLTPMAIGVLMLGLAVGCVSVGLYEKKQLSRVRTHKEKLDTLKNDLSNGEYFDLLEKQGLFRQTEPTAKVSTQVESTRRLVG